MKCQHSFNDSALEARFEWLSIAPLERPVVPEVYKNEARSSLPRGTSLKFLISAGNASVSVPVPAAERVNKVGTPANHATNPNKTVWDAYSQGCVGLDRYIAILCTII